MSAPQREAAAHPTAQALRSQGATRCGVAASSLSSLCILSQLKASPDGLLHRPHMATGEWLFGEWLARGLAGARMRPRRAAAAGGLSQAYVRKARITLRRCRRRMLAWGRVYHSLAGISLASAPRRGALLSEQHTSPTGQAFQMSVAARAAGTAAQKTSTPRARGGARQWGSDKTPQAGLAVRRKRMLA